MKGDSMEKKATGRVTQHAQVLAYLKHGMRITQRQAARWNIWRLADVVFKLRADGWNIKTTMRSNKGAGNHAEYHLGRPYTFKGRRVKVVVGIWYYKKDAEGEIISISSDGDYLVKFDKGKFHHNHEGCKTCHWVKPGHVKFIKGIK